MSLLKECSDNIRSRKVDHVSDVFSINSYVGTSSSDNAVITDFNMQAADYAIKIKNKDGKTDHAIYDTLRGINKELNINNNSEVSKETGLSIFNTEGFVVNNSPNINLLGNKYSVTTFKKSPKFFDIVKYVGDGLDNRTIHHDLNMMVGLLTLKPLDIYSDWYVYHKNATGELTLNTNNKQYNNFTNIVEVTSTHFKVANEANLLGVNYIVYLYANDTDYTGKIQCGMYIGGLDIITNTVIGSGKINIPVEVNEVTIICKGGTGGNNVWYDPGQPYLPPVLEQPYVAPVYGWQYIDDYSFTSNTPVTTEVWNSYSKTKPYPPALQPTKETDPLDPTTFVYVSWWTGTREKPVFWSGHYSSYLISEEKQHIEAKPGQAYKPPTSGGGIFTGNFSTFSLNEINYSFPGGVGGPAMPERKVINLTNSKNRILSYNIAPGGSLVYSYKIGGNTNVTINFEQPPIKFSTNIAGIGSIIIPEGVNKVTVRCSGGIGSNDAWTDPGQPYKAPTPDISQVGLPEYPNGLPPYVKAVAGVTGQGNPAYPNGLPTYVAPVSAVAGVAQQGLLAYPYGLPPYQAGVSTVTGQGIPEYPNGLPPYVPAVTAVPAVGNSAFPSGLPVYIPAVPEVPAVPAVGDPLNPAGPPAYVPEVPAVPAKPAVGDSGFPLGLPAYVPAVAAGAAIGVSTYPLGLPTYVAGIAGGAQVGIPDYPNGLPPYVAPVTAVAGVTGQGNAAYPNGLPYYIPPVTAVIGKGKSTFPDGLEPYRPSAPATPGQLYKPPTSGGGDILGEESVITLDNKVFKFKGSFGVVTPEVSTQSILLNGKTTETLTFSIPSSGKLNIEYDIPNYDILLESNFEPYYLIIKKLTDSGEWYEFDCRNKDYQFLMNNSTPLLNTNMIEVTKNGFIANSLLVNELNEHYIYLVVRR